MDMKDFGAVLKKHGIRSGSGVPCSYFTPVVNYMGADPELTYVPATSEGEAVAIAAGMTAAGRPAFALMQNSGLGNAVNPITSMLYIYKMPVSLLVSHRGEPGVPDEPQHERMGVITEELSALCGIETRVMKPETIDAEIGEMQARSEPAAWIFRKDTLTGGPKAPPFEMVVATGAFARPAPGRYEAKVPREDALRAILPVLNGGLDGAAEQRVAVVSTTGKQSRELYELDDREHDKKNRFYMVGSMGCAAGFGLGIAVSSKGKTVVLDGDGALLMKLGTVATIGWSKPKSFHHVLIDNGAHDSTGAQATASPWVDFATIALASGYRVAETVDDPAAFRAALERHLGTEGPTFLRMIAKTGARKDLGRPKLAPRDNYTRFAKFLAEAGAR